MTRLRAILKLMRGVRTERIIKRFQRLVRRVLALTVLARSIKKKRQFPNMSNPKVQRALFRLKVITWLKRSEASIVWKEKFRRAKRRIRGILSIQRIVEAERKERDNILEWGKSANLPLSMIKTIMKKNKA